MSARSVAVLLVAGIAVISFAIWLASQRHLDRATLAGDLVLPGLESAVNTVTEVDLHKGDGSRSTLRKVATGWQVAERAWPADFGKVRKLLLDLAALNVVEEKTRLPANYPRLGVEDVGSPKATGTQIDVLTPARRFALIVGKSSGGKSGYVRVVGSEASLLAAPLLTPDAQPKAWLDHALLDIPQTRVREVEEKPADGPGYTAGREKKEQTDFTVTPIPRLRELTGPGAADEIAAALNSLTLDDVQKGPAPADTRLSHAIFRTFDGLELEVAGRKDGARSLVAFTARSTAKASASEAQQLNARLAGWEFEIPDYKYGAIFRALEDLLKPPPAKKPAAAPKVKTLGLSPAASPGR
jgi:hypothetical protein